LLVLIYLRRSLSVVVDLDHNRSARFSLGVLWSRSTTTDTLRGFVQVDRHIAAAAGLSATT
jgi:hypothetical protein